MLAVGERFLGEVSSEWVKMATPFGGGVGGTHLEMCGALTGGVMLIGALSGRVSADEDSQPSRDLAARFRERFLNELGNTQCERLRQELIEPPGGWGSCDVLVERAAGILVQVLQGAGFS